MKTLRILILALILLLLAVPAIQAGGGGGLWVQRFVLSTGGGAVTGGDFALHSTTGQPVVDVMSDSGYAVRSGFWFWYQHKVMVPMVLKQ